MSYSRSWKPVPQCKVGVLCQRGCICPRSCQLGWGTAPLQPHHLHKICSYSWMRGCTCKGICTPGRESLAVWTFLQTPAACASPEQHRGSSHLRLEQNKLSEQMAGSEHSAWLLSNGAVNQIFLLTGFIQFSYCILETLYLCNHKALG